jgi:caffeoyl-CoA O-methyltransferase
MFILPDQIWNSTSATTPRRRAPHLQQLERETHLKVLMPRMLSGQVQGKFLEFISRMIQPDAHSGNWNLHRIQWYLPGERIERQEAPITTIDINQELNRHGDRRYVDTGRTQPLL